jgi:predicted O-methyltransferase YrrM
MRPRPSLDPTQPEAPSFRQRVKGFARRHPLLYLLYNFQRLLKGQQIVFLDYPVTPAPRWGFGKPAHAALAEILGRNRESYRQTLASFLQFQEHLLKIPRTAAADSPQPCWVNKWLPPPDEAALYGFLGLNRPQRYVEVGSGQSTKWARRAIRDLGLATRITSIDPHPRAEVDALCDTVLRRRLQELPDAAVFDALEPGDIVFVDGSHRIFMNSDVTVFFLEVLPRLKPGVLVQVHDVALPYDYPPAWADWFYSEQYLLAFALLEGSARFEVVLPNAYVSGDAELAAVLGPLWQHPALAGVKGGGMSFWLRTK